MPLKESKIGDDIYITSILSESITLPADKITSNIGSVILKELKQNVGNKCGSHGYIDMDSISIIKRSIGKLNSGHLNGSLSYEVSYKANVCNPVDGSLVTCEVVNKNKMGLLASAPPLSIVLARQHHPDTPVFEKINIGDIITIKVIGKRFELYDDQITAIGELV